MRNRPSYLDYQSTTPVDPRVIQAINQAFDLFGNPHGRQHAYGRDAAEAVDQARALVSGLIGAYPDRVIFTSGATESCNLALRGAVSATASKRRQIVTLATEHSAVLDTVRDIQQQGYETTILPVKTDGIVDLNLIEEVVSERTLIVSVMAVNNEIGVLQPLADIASICHRHGALFHTDATQAPARIEVDVERWGVDLLSLSAHKIYGPKGVGALFVADDSIVSPLITGGGQERGLRSGTVPTSLVSGFGAAADFALTELTADTERMASLGEKLRNGIDEFQICINHFGSDGARAPGTMSFGFRGIPGDKLVAMVEDDIAISTGAACSTGSEAVSHVLAALGCTHDEAITGVRMALGRFSTESDVDVAIGALERVAHLAE